jgi:type VI secretion system secreted protein Hcp
MALFDAFLKLDGIKGESADAKHKGEIDIMSFSWGMSQTGVSATGGGGGAGKVHVHDFQITKKTDASSPLLFLNCANGAHIKEANFVVRKAGGEQLEYLKIKLTDVLVSSYKPAGNDDSELIGLLLPAVQVVDKSSIPSEQVTFNFAKVEFSYQPQGADGKAQGGPILAGWDVKANQKV